MAIVYVDSAGSNTSPYDTWAKAATTLQTALTAYTAGDEIWVAHNHAETPGASVTWTDSAAATALQRVPIYRVNSGTNSYDPTTGADTKQLDISAGEYDLVNVGWMDYHGLYLHIGDDIFDTQSLIATTWTDCYLLLSSASAYFRFGNSSSNSQSVMKNTTIDSTGGSLTFLPSGGDMKFYGCTFKGPAQSTGLFRAATNREGNYIFEGCDFSGLTGTIILFDLNVSAAVFDIKLINCLMPTTYTLHDSGFTHDHQSLEIYNSDDAGNLYVSRKETVRGTVNEDTGVYVSGGFQDADGTTSLSMVMTTRAATTEPHTPLESLPILARIESTGAKTFTVECVENFTTALTKREAWIEVYYLGSATETNWSIANDREFAESSYTNLAAGTGLANWTGEPAGSRSVKLTATATVNQAGLFMVKVFLGEFESGKVLHYDPEVTVS